MKLALILLLVAPYCVFAQNIETYVKDISAAKKGVADSVLSTPYLKEQHGIFKNYFVELGGLAEDIRNMPKLAKKYDSYLRNVGLESFCSQIFLETLTWDVLLKNCTKNRFFLCANEVKGLPEYKKGLRDLMADDLKSEFDASLSCIQ
jgi:hypothetical protein